MKQAPVAAAMASADWESFFRTLTPRGRRTFRLISEMTAVMAATVAASTRPAVSGASPWFSTRRAWSPPASSARASASARSTTSAMEPPQRGLPGSGSRCTIPISARGTPRTSASEEAMAEFYHPPPRDGLWREGLVHRRVGATRARPSRDDEDPTPDGGGAEAVPRCRHGRPRRPRIGCRIVGLDLVEGPRGRLAAADEDLPVKHRRGNPAARCRQWRALPPVASPRVILLVGLKVPRIAAVESAADGVEPFPHDASRQVVSGGWQRGKLCPPIGGRVVHLVRPRIAPVSPDPTDGVDLPIDHADGESPAGGRHVRPLSPLVGGRVVLEDRIDRVPSVMEIRVAADHIEAPAHRGGRRVVECPRERGALSPPIGHPIIF